MYTGIVEVSMEKVCSTCNHAVKRSPSNIAYNGWNFAPFECCLPETKSKYKEHREGCEKWEGKDERNV